MRKSQRVDLTVQVIGPDRRTYSSTTAFSEVDEGGYSANSRPFLWTMKARFISKDVVRTWMALQVKDKFYVIPPQTLRSGESNTVLLSGGGKVILSASIRPQAADEKWWVEFTIRDEEAKRNKPPANGPMAPFVMEPPLSVWSD